MNSELSFPKTNNFSLHSVERFAQEISNTLQYQIHKDIRRIVKKIGGSIEIKNFYPRYLSQMGEIRVHVDNHNMPIIYLPLHTSRTHDNFTIAHELGHYFLHFIIPNSPNAHRENFSAQSNGEIKISGTHQTEIEANWFALSFLMPREEFLSAQHTGESHEFYP